MMGVFCLFVLVSFMIIDSDATMPESIKSIVRNIFLLTVLLTIIYVIKFEL